MPQPLATRSIQRGQVVLVVIVLVLLILLGLAFMTFRHDSGGGRLAGPTAAPTPTVDPRLILHPHTLTIAATLTDGVRVTGTLAPDLPGTNTFNMALQGPPSRLRGAAHLRLEASMPGMRMAPVWNVMPVQHARYGGAMILPMFGTYRVAVEVPTNTGMITGVLTVTIPLPTFSP